MVIALIASFPVSLGLLSIDPAQACACVGNTWSTPEPLTDPSVLADDVHTISIGSTVYAVWVEPATQTTSSLVMTSSSYDLGVTWSIPIQIAGDSHSPIIVASSNEQPSIFFIQNIGAGSSKIMTSVSSSGGQSWAIPVIVVSDVDNADEFSNLSAAALPNGEFALSWIYQVSNTSTSNNIGFSMSDQGQWSAPQPFMSAPPSSDVSYTGVELTSGTLGESSTLVMSWNKIDNVNATQEVQYVWAPIPQGGASWSWSSVVGLSTDLAYRVHTEAVPSGGFVFGWTEYGDYGAILQYAGFYDSSGIVGLSQAFYSQVLDSPRFRIGPDGHLVSVIEYEEENDNGDLVPFLNILQFNANESSVNGSFSTAPQSRFSRELVGINTDYDRPWPSVSEDGSWILPYVETTPDGDALYVLQGQGTIKPGAAPLFVEFSDTTSLGWVDSAALSGGRGVLIWMAEASQNYSGPLFTSNQTTVKTSFVLQDWSAPISAPDLSSFQDEMSYWRSSFTVVETAHGYSAFWVENDVNQNNRVVSATSADGETWSSSVPLSDPTNYIRGLGVEVNPSGTNIYVAWSSGDDQNFETPRVVTSLNSGVSWSQEMALFGVVDAQRPDIVTFGELSAVARTGLIDGSSVLATTYDGGNTWTQVVLPTVVTEADAFIAPDGTLHVAYGFSSNPGEFEVFTATKTPSGPLVQTSRTIVSADNIFNTKIQQSPFELNKIAVSWYTADVNFEHTNVTVKRSTDHGTTWGVPVTLAQSGFSYWGEDLTWNSEGDLIFVGVVFQDTTQIWLTSSTRLASDSHSWSEIVVISDLDSDSYGVTRASQDGTIVSILWREHSFGSVGSTYSLLSTVSTDGGESWTAPLQVTDPEQDISDISLSVDEETNDWTLNYMTQGITVERMVTTLSLPSSSLVPPPSSNEPEGNGVESPAANRPASGAAAQSTILENIGGSPADLELGAPTEIAENESSESRATSAHEESSSQENNVLFLSIGALVIAAAAGGGIALFKLLKPA